MRRLRLGTIALLLLTSIASAQTTRRREAAVPADAASVDAAVSALYASVSHAPDGSPDFERLRGIFLYTGMFVPPVRPGREIAVSDVDQFAEKFKDGAAARKEKGQPGRDPRSVKRRRRSSAPAPCQEPHRRSPVRQAPA